MCVCVCVCVRERERERENIFSNKKVHSLGQKVYSYGRRRKKSFQNIFLYFPPFSFFHTFFVEISEKTSNRRLKEGKIITLKQSFMTWQVSGIGVTVRLVHSDIGSPQFESHIELFSTSCLEQCLNMTIQTMIVLLFPLKSSSIARFGIEVVIANATRLVVIILVGSRGHFILKSISDAPPREIC